MNRTRLFLGAALVALALASPAVADELPDDLVCPLGSTLDPFGAGQCVDDTTGTVVGTWGTDGTYTPEPAGDDLDPDVDPDVLSEGAYRPTPADVNDLPIPPTPIAQTPTFTG